MVRQIKVDEAVSQLALMTSYNQTIANKWALEIAPLQKPAGGWDFSDPTRYPLPRDDVVYGDRKAFERRRQHLLDEFERWQQQREEEKKAKRKRGGRRRRR